MSGGEPSSIKRFALCAAASLHTYVSDFFTGGLDLDKRFFLKKLWQHFLPTVPLMFTMGLIYMMLFDQPNVTPDLFQKAFFWLCELSLAATAAISAYVEAQYAAHAPMERRILRGSFKGFSEKSKLFSEGMEYLRLGNLPDGIACFKESMKCENCTEREKAVASFYIGVTYQQMGYSTNASIFLRDALDLGLDDETCAADILLARCYAENGSYQKAVDIYEKLISIDKDRGNRNFDYLFTDYGMCRLSMQDYDGAFKLFYRSVCDARNFSFALGGCSLAALGMKNIDLSREYYARALAANLRDVIGFKQYYCKIAESVGIIDKIDKEMKISY